jgi:hypothetical protein
MGMIFFALIPAVQAQRIASRAIAKPAIRFGERLYG